MKITLDIPQEFIDLCIEIGVEPERVLRQFIADAAAIFNWTDNPRTDGYGTGGSDERRMAREYMLRCGYALDWWMKRSKEDGN